MSGRASAIARGHHVQTLLYLSSMSLSSLSISLPRSVSISISLSLSRCLYERGRPRSIPMKRVSTLSMVRSLVSICVSLGPRS